MIPGPIRGNDIRPGHLCHRSFDAGFRPLGETTRPLGDTVVYELDATPHGEEDAVAATTAEGVLLLLGTAAAGAFAVRERKALRPAHPLTSPAVQSLGGDLHLAFLAGADTPQSRVLHGVSARSQP